MVVLGASTSDSQHSIRPSDQDIKIRKKGRYPPFLVAPPSVCRGTNRIYLGLVVPRCVLDAAAPSLFSRCRSYSKPSTLRPRCARSLLPSWCRPLNPECRWRPLLTLAFARLPRPVCNICSVVGSLLKRPPARFTRHPASPSHAMRAPTTNSSSSVGRIVANWLLDMAAFTGLPLKKTNNRRLE